MRSILLVCLLFISFEGMTQNRTNWGLEARMRSGFLIGHRVVMGHLANDHTYAAELSYVFRTNGEKSWHKHYKYPELSANLYYGSVGNTEILGNFFGAYVSLSIPFVAKEKFRLNGKLGSGLGYTGKIYDEALNKKNVAVSTHLNALINIGLDAKTYFRKNWITVGIDLTHFSNGGFKVPNLGLNIPQISLGYGRFISKNPEYSTLERPTAIPQRTLILGATAIGSVKEVFPTNERAYPVFALSLHARMFMKPKVGWEVAFDAISKQAIMGYRPEIQKSQWDITQFGIYAGYLLPLNQFHFVLGMGAYVKDKYKADGPLYHRVGMRYYLKNGVHFNLVLKSHWGKADYVEWGVGYSFFNLLNGKK